MANNRKVYIVLLNYNGTKDTIECLESLLKIDYSDFQVIVVDNSETMGPFEQLIDWSEGNCKIVETQFEDLIYPISEKPIGHAIFLEENWGTKSVNEKIIFVKAEKNRGFAAGNNIALRYVLKYGVEDSLVWILNNDTVVEKKALLNQVNYLNPDEKSRVGLLGSKLLYYHLPDQIQAVGGRFNNHTLLPTHIGEKMPADTAKSKLRKIDYPVGASILTSLKFIKEVGIMNEAYFLFFEELDWTKRGASYSWDIDWCPDSIIYHKEGASIGSSSIHNRSDFSEIQFFKSRKKFVNSFFKLGWKYYLTTIALLFKKVIKGKILLSFKLIKTI